MWIDNFWLFVISWHQIHVIIIKYISKNKNNANNVTNPENPHMIDPSNCAIWFFCYINVKEEVKVEVDDSKEYHFMISMRVKGYHLYNHFNLFMVEMDMKLVSCFKASQYTIYSIISNAAVFVLPF